MRRILVLVVFAFLTFGTAAPLFAQTCPSCAIRTGPNASVGAWVSVPTSAYYKSGGNYISLARAEDLCSALGASATSVSQHFPGNNNEYSWNCAGGAGACTDAAGAPTAPEPGLCGSACFCIDDGEGYEVFTPGASVSVQLYGTDSPGLITVPGGYVGPAFGALVSIPCLPTIFSASDVCALLGMGLGAGNVARLDPNTGTLTQHACGLAANNFFLVPGEAIRIRKSTAGNVTYANPINTSPGVPPAMANAWTQTYCITGTTNLGGWSWWIDLGADGLPVALTPEPLNSSVPGLSSGGPPDFSAAFASSISAACPGIATVNAANTDCFDITAPAPFNFAVGPAGGPPNAGGANCNPVTTLQIGGGSGCSFNPEIYLESTGIPTLGEIGTVAVAFLLVSGAAFLLARRRGIALRH